MNGYQQHEQQFGTCRLCPIATGVKTFYRSDRTPYCECAYCLSGSNYGRIGVGLEVDYLFIGEAPGPSERIIGHPFVGVAGKVLDALIEDSGISGYGITNLISCFPAQPENKSKFRRPYTEEVQACEPRLSDLIERIVPKYYIALGKEAKKNPPSGVVYALELDHPSYLLRRGGKNSIEYKRNRHRLRKFLETS